MFMCSLAAFLVMKGSDNEIAEVMAMLLVLFGALEVVLELYMIAGLLGVQ